MIRPIVLRGESQLLEKRSVRVTKFGRRLAALVNDLWDTMYAARGVGLAAPQIGVRLQVAVIDVSFGEAPEAKIVLVNPKLDTLLGEQVEDEGCLSMPGHRISKRRYNFVTVRAYNLKGKEFSLTGEGLLARALQHECDHLNGVLLEIPR